MLRKEKARKRLGRASMAQCKVDRVYYGELKLLNQVKTEMYSQDYISDVFSKGGCYEGL